MTELSCPSCGHTFTHPTPSASTEVGPATPDPTVVRWFRTDPGWLGELSTDEVYGSYLRASGDSPVSRRRFVTDLAHFGVEEVLDDDTAMLIRS